MIQRNDICFCGSGKKYKNCHMEIMEKIKYYENLGYIVPDISYIKTVDQIKKIKESAKLNTKVLNEVEKNIKEGMTTQDIDDIVYTYTKKNGGIPASLNYNGFPKSVCTSKNDIICHGIPNKYDILKNGDIINVDVSTILDGYYSDASRMFKIGKISNNAEKLINVTEEAVKKGLKQAIPWNRLGDIAYEINTFVQKNGYSVVRDIGGHGIGLKFHENPFVSYVLDKNDGMLLVPGMIFTIEPMINEGSNNYYIDKKNGWTVRTKDKKLSAQIEYMVLITENGNEILTK